MLPIVLKHSAGRVGLSGEGASFESRRQWLAAAGMELVIIGPHSELGGLTLLFIAGLPTSEAAALASRARAQDVLVNVEDEPPLCDFHVPALVRRGDLLISVSTGGRAPGLARLLREWLDSRFGPEWATYLDQASDARVAWRA